MGGATSSLQVSGSSIRFADRYATVQKICGVCNEPVAMDWVVSPAGNGQQIPAWICKNKACPGSQSNLRRASPGIPLDVRCYQCGAATDLMYDICHFHDFSCRDAKACKARAEDMVSV